MTRSAGVVQYNGFKNGLVTEATGLSYPESSVQDIDNCDIELEGTVRRRLGLDLENGAFPLVDDKDIFPGGGADQNDCPRDELAITWHVWDNPSSRTDLTFFVVQVGIYLIILNYNNEAVSGISSIESLISAGREIDITDHLFLNTVKSAQTEKERRDGAPREKLSSASGNGRLYLTGRLFKPFYLEYDDKSGIVSNYNLGAGIPANLSGGGTLFDVTEEPLIRDFNGVKDGLETDFRPEYLSKEHAYNLRNQGWKTSVRVFNSEDGGDGTSTGDSIELFKNKSFNNNTYPSNADIIQFYRSSVAEDVGAVGSFNFFRKRDDLFGNTPAPKGHFKIGLLTGNRDNVARNIPPPGESESPLIDFDGKFDSPTAFGFKAVGFFSGRLWLSGDQNKDRSNGVYFSQIIQNREDAAKFYQESDPTAEDFNQLKADDGGVIYFPDASNILALEPYGAGMVVMAENGIWFIYGDRTGFSATEYSVEKISSTGVISSESVVRTENVIAFWAQNSIHVIALPQQGAVPIVKDIAEDKIFGFYSNINREARKNAYGCYDSISKKVFWAYLEEDEYNFPKRQSAYNKMLILDGRTGAFTQYSFNSNPDKYQYIGPPFPKRTGTVPKSLDPVLVGTDSVVLSSGENVIAVTEKQENDEFLNSIKTFLINGEDQGNIYIGEFYDLTFRDFNRVPGFDVNSFKSYVVTKPELLEDLTKHKKVTYLHSFFERTEEGWENNFNGDLVPIRPSGCTVRAQWGWNDSPAGNEWGKPQKAYRYRRRYVPSGPEDEFDNGDSIVYTKLKIRGRGRAVAFRYESVDHQDFKLYGYAAQMTKSNS